MKKTIVVDMQNAFVYISLGTPEAQEMLPCLAAKPEKEQAAGTALIFTMDTYSADYLQTQEG